MAQYDPDYVKKLIKESRLLVNRSSQEKKKRKELCVTCREKIALEGHTRCEICQPVHEREVGLRRANRLLSRENKPDMMYDRNGKLVYVHRHVMMEFQGRELEPHEAVWWRNGDKKDNRIENLVLGVKAGYPLDDLVCPHCQRKYYKE